jgi:phospholipid/cholesterol/gamma-HCH transport system substrate-binding protein
MTLKREHKTAIIVVVALALFIWGFNFLKGKDIFNSYNTYYSIMDNVEGVVSSTPVTLKGIQIGTVKDMQFVNGFEKTMLVLDIDSHYKFSKDSKVKIYGGNIMGGKNIAIVPGNSEQLAKNGDTLQALKMPGMFDLVNDKITPLQNKLDRILSSTDTLLLGINNVLNPQTQEHLNKTIADLSATVHQFKATSYKLNGLLDKNQTHLNNSIENFDKISQNLAVLTDSLKVVKIGKLTKDIQQSIAKLNQSLDKLNHGDGTVAKLMNDKKLYENLARSTKELELLLKDLREHPKRYVHFSIWGRKEKK